jgi:hypothetical protein
MHISSSISVRIASAATAISLGLFVAACEKGGASTQAPEGGDAAGDTSEAAAEEPAEEEAAAEEDAGGW